jgi:prepilin-type processing-associated H-X9-DG protein
MTTTPPAGSPLDPYSWFNLLPPLVADKSLDYYFQLTGAPSKKLPFPGNGVGKIWHCPSAVIALGDVFMSGGTYGVFSYVMDLDLKLKRDISHGVVGNSFTYPEMPKLSSIRHPSAQVFVTEQAFSPTLEAYTPDPTRNGILPAHRWSVFPKRHSGGGTIVFIDGHSAFFKYDYVFNPNPVGDPRVEKLNDDVWWNPNRDK